MQGTSLAPLINDKTDGKKYVNGFSAYTTKAFIRDRQWKLITDHFLRKEGYKLFKLIEDPLELHDLKDRYPEIAENLKIVRS